MAEEEDLIAEEEEVEDLHLLIPLLLQEANDQKKAKLL